MIDRLRAGDFGVGPDNILRGPGGLRVDLNKCPSNWDNLAGLEKDTISLALTSAQSGNLAAYGDLGVGMLSYFDYVNDNGGVDGRRLNLLLQDDGYLATVTIDLVEQMLAGRQPFAITTLGTPNGLAVYDRLNDQCVPQPFVISGHPAWSEAVEHPFTMGLQMSYRTEAALWGEWIKRNLADQLPVSVRSLVMEHDFGLSYDQAFSRWVRDNPGVVSDYQAVRHNAAAATVTDEMTTIEQADPDVFISMTAGTPCLLAVQEAGSRDLVPKAVGFTPSVCRDELSYMLPAGDNADGFLSVSGGIREPTDPAYAGDPFVAFVNKTLRSDGLGSTDGLYGTGFGLYGWTYVEALRIAAELDGGLSRSNLVLAMWALNLEHPMAMDGVRLVTNGQRDPFPLEGSNVERWDAAGERWRSVSGTIDINGKTASCSWKPSVGC